MHMAVVIPLLSYSKPIQWLRGLGQVVLGSVGACFACYKLQSREGRFIQVSGAITRLNYRKRVKKLRRNHVTIGDRPCNLGSCCFTSARRCALRSNDLDLDTW